MPEPIKEELNFSSVAELQDEATRSFNKKVVLNDKMFKHSFNLCFNRAEKSLREGNREDSYILLYRAVNLYHAFLRSDQCDEKFMKLHFGRQLNDAIKQLEILQADLERNYAWKKKIEGEKRNFEQDENVHNKLSKLSLNQPNLNDIRSRTSVEDNKSSKLSISSTELYNLINEKACTTLILDIRPKEDFEKSSMKVSDIVNIPENIIIPGNIASKLESLIEKSFRPFFMKRGEYELVVVVDWCSKSCTDAHPKMLLMLKVLQTYDVNTNYKSKPVMLEGGYEDWLYRYPTLTTNASISPPKESIGNKFVLEDINYPSNTFFEIQQVEKPAAAANLSPNIKPSFDRSTKPSVLPEKKQEVFDEPSRNHVESAVKKFSNTAANENYVTKIIVKNEQPEPVPSVSMNGRRESLESDEEGLKQHYHRSGRRSALTENEVQSPLLNRKNKEETEESWDSERVHDNDETFRGKKAVNHICNDYGMMKKKGYSSTPDMSKVGINEPSRPVIDRSTKPSNDDQLNYYNTTGCIYNEVGKGLTGLRNIGNTCYMNSILQCLSNTDPLRKELCSWDMRAINEKSKTRGAVAREVISIMKQLWSGDGGSISCKSFKNIIGQYNEMFSGHDQQDSHEFLTILIDWLHEDLNESTDRQILNGADEKSGEKAWGEFINKNNSIIRKLFYGQLRSTVSCSTCKKESITFEPFSNLSLSLPPEEISSCSLAECLKLYISNDEIDKWQCPGCKELRKGTKKLDITKLPPLLVIHFKRFTSIGGCKKQRTFVDFPDTLNMKPYVVGTEHRHQEYQLYAVSNHLGSMESGHYTAHCKNPVDKKWYEFDDQNVYQMKMRPKSREAYIVFYQTVKN